MTSNLPPLVKFDCGAEAELLGLQWIKWKRAFEIYLTAANIEKAETKRATLLHCGGTDLQEVFYSISGSQGSGNAEDNVYDIAIEKLEEYFTPRKISYTKDMYSETRKRRKIRHIYTQVEKLS